MPQTTITLESTISLELLYGIDICFYGKAAVGYD
jgi:hypothetical protein